MAAISLQRNTVAELRFCFACSADVAPDRICHRGGAAWLPQPDHDCRLHHRKRLLHQLAARWAAGLWKGGMPPSLPDGLF